MIRRDHAPSLQQERVRRRRIGLGAATLLATLATLAALVAAPGPCYAGDPEVESPPRAYDFELEDVNPRSRSYGRKLRLSELYAAEGIVMNFMASWCGPCRDELPLLQSLHKAGRARVVCMAADEYGGAEGLLPVIEQTGLTVPVLYAPDAAAARIAEHYTYQILPATYLIDRSGVVRSTFQGLVPKKALLGAIDRDLK